MLIPNDTDKYIMLW